MPQKIDFLTLYVNKLGICEYADSNTTIFEALTIQKVIQNIPLDQLFKDSRFYTPIVSWLQNGRNEFWEDVIEDVFKSFVVSIQPIRINSIVAAVTIRTSAVSRKIDQLKYQYESTLENSNVGLWIWMDTASGQSWWSDSFYKLLGYEIDEMKPGIESFVKLVHPEQLEYFTTIMKSFYDEQTSNQKIHNRNLEIKMRTKTGSYKYLLFTSNSKSVDSVVRFSGTVVDIDLLKKTEIELQHREAQLQLSMEAGNMGTWTWEINTNEVIWSEHLYQIFEIEKEQFEGNFDSYMKVISNEDRNGVKEKIENAMHEGHEQFSFEHCLLNSKFSKKILYSKGRIFREKGKPYRMTGIVLDISKEHELKTLLGQSKERYKAVIEAMSEGVIIVDMLGIIIDHNSAASNIIGYESLSLSGNDLSYGEGIAIREDFSSFPLEEFPAIKTIATSETFRNVPLGWIKPNKDVVWLSINSEPVFDEFARQVAVVCTYSDITERYLALSNLKIKNRQLEDFAQITSHNLRSPISNLSILLDYFETSHDENERNEYFQNLKHVSSNLLDTIQILAESLKIQKDFVEDEEEIYFQDTLNNVMKLLSGQIKDANVEFNIDFDLCKSIHYSKTYLESIFINLISNCIKYRDLDRKPIIHIRSEQNTQNKTILSISDNGIGIDMNKHGGKIFGLYKTFHPNRDSRGVGLYMIKRQIETLGGSISVSSKIDVGSTFTIQF
jgi:PAS domain S-box-containing protein